MTLPRILHRIYARVRGYRWKPCPICKREFGAHEAATVLLYVSPGNSESVCRPCTFEAVDRNMDRLAMAVRMTQGGHQVSFTVVLGGADLPRAS